MSHMSFSTHLARISDGAKLGKHLVLISAISRGAFTGTTTAVKGELVGADALKDVRGHVEATVEAMIRDE